ncbi:Rho GTPase activation protein [Paraphysoderma sedebokerense]|nr:Rho GTPase activation protein [Paraphysoderma sedebokerense]
MWNDNVEFNQALPRWFDSNIILQNKVSIEDFAYVFGKTLIQKGLEQENQSSPAYVRRNVLSMCQREDFPLSSVKQLLLASDMTLVMVLLYLEESDLQSQHNLSVSLVTLYHSDGSLLELLEESTFQEINRQVLAEHCFKRPSVATAMVMTYFRYCGLAWLKECLGPIIPLIITAGPENYEIDPQKLPTKNRKKSLKKNVKNVKNIVDLLLDNISRLIPQMPTILRSVFKHILRATNIVFLRPGTQAVLNLLYLHLICPALEDPYSYGIVSAKVNSDCQASLAIVSRLIKVI